MPGLDLNAPITISDQEMDEDSSSGGNLWSPHLGASRDQKGTDIPVEDFREGVSGDTGGPMEGVSEGVGGPVEGVSEDLEHLGSISPYA